jgi:hypothetical protein
VVDVPAAVDEDESLCFLHLAVRSVSQ